MTADSPGYRPGFPALLGFHAAIVDDESTFVNQECATDSLFAMEDLPSMGDARHKRPPPDEIEEDVTPEFRRDVLEALDINARQNRLRRLRKGDPGYLVSNRAELAVAIGTDKTNINKILGPARSSSKVKLADRSTFVGRIRDVLQLAPVTRIAVKLERAPVLEFFNRLSDDAFRVFEEEYQRELRKQEDHRQK